MKRDEYSTARPTLKRWSNGSRTAEPHAEHQAPINLIERLSAGAIINYEPRPDGEQFKRALKLSTMIGLTIKHAVCRITGSLIRNDYFPKLIRKTISMNIFSKLIH